MMSFVDDKLASEMVLFVQRLADPAQFDSGYFDLLYDSNQQAFLQIGGDLMRLLRFKAMEVNNKAFFLMRVSKEQA